MREKVWTRRQNRISQIGIFLYVVLFFIMITNDGCTHYHAKTRYPDTPQKTILQHDLDFALERIRWEKPFSNSDLNSIEEKINAWSYKPWPSPGSREEIELIDITDAIYTTAQRRQVVSMVRISTFPDSGATIRYQTYGQRDRQEEPWTANGLSACVERLPIGWYYIWSERDSISTSNQNYLRVIIDPEEEVEIEEIQND